MALLQLFRGGFSLTLPCHGRANPIEASAANIPCKHRDWRFAFAEMDCWVEMGSAEIITEDEARREELLIPSLVVHGSKPLVVLD
jgi:hypothetical protein